MALQAEGVVDGGTIGRKHGRIPGDLKRCILGSVTHRLMRKFIKSQGMAPLKFETDRL